MLIELILFVIVLVLVFIWTNKTPPGLPPGPRRIPILGSASFIKKMQDSFTIQEKYGDIASIKGGSANMIVLSSHKLAREAFNKAEISDRPPWKLLQFLADGKTGVLGRNGEQWLHSRRFHLKNLRDLGMGKSYLAEAILQEAKILVEEFHNYTDEPSPLPPSINVAVLNVVWQLVAGCRYDLHDEKIQELQALTQEFQRNLKFIILPDIFPWLKYLPKNLFRRAFKYDWHEECGSRAKKFMKEFVDDHKNSLDPSSPRDLIDEYLIELDKQKTNTHSNVFSEDDLIRDIFDLFAAGSDTTTNTIKWICHYLAAHPDVQRKFQRELDEVVGRDNLPSLLHRPQLPYVEATLLEVMRMSPVSLLGAPHFSTVDVHIGGYIIPKESIVVTNIAAIHYDTRYWEQPQKFLPERFINESGNLSIPKEGFLPFSVGKRSCLGEALARMELFLFTAALLQNFSLAPPEGCEIDLEPNDVDGMMFPNVQDLIITSRI